MRYVAVAMMTLLPVAASGQQVIGPAPEPTVVASGQGVVFAVPDRAWITMSCLLHY